MDQVDQEVKNHDEDVQRKDDLLGMDFFQVPEPDSLAPQDNCD